MQTQVCNSGGKKFLGKVGVLFVDAVVVLFFKKLFCSLAKGKMHFGTKIT